MSEMSQIDLKQRDMEKRIEKLEQDSKLDRSATQVLFDMQRKRIRTLEQQVELDGMRQDLLRGMVKDLIDICGQK